MAISREVKIGALALAAIAMLLVGISWLRNSNLINPPLRLHTVYGDVDGLVVGAPVLMNGMTVGAVRGMEITNQGRGVLVRYEVDTEVPIPRDSRAVIISPSLIGGKALALALGRSGDYVATGDTLRDSLQVSTLNKVASQVDPIADQVQRLTAQLNQTVSHLNTALDSNRLGRILVSTERTTNNLARGSAQLEGVLANTRSLTETLKRNEQNLNTILANSAGISDSLRTAMTDLKTTLHQTSQAVANVNQITSQLAQGQGTAGKLLTDEDLYNNLNKTAADLDKLLVEIKERPGRFLSFSVFGKGDRE